jgi:peptide/nickel transport system permease protein
LTRSAAVQAIRTASLWLAVHVGQALILLLAASILAFGLLQLSTGSAVAARAGDTGLTPQQYTELRHELGLDRPVIVRYADWLSHAVRGDLGVSLANSQPVTSLIASHLPITLSLAFLAGLLTIGFAILFGVVAAVFENRWPDRVITVWSSAAIAAPTFFIGLVLVLVFALQAGLLPATGFVRLTEDPVEYLKHLLLPAVTLAIPYSAGVGRQLRNSMVTVLATDYVRAAEAKGMPWWQVVLKHGLRNAAIPAVTLFGLELIALFGGAVLVEAVFALPGIGTLAVSAVLARDSTTILGILMVACLTAIVINSLVDVTYGMLNPRLRHG